MAARSKLSISRLSQIENGHHVLDAVEADAIAEAFGLSLEALLPADVTIPYVIARDNEIRMTAARNRSAAPDPSGATASRVGRSRNNSWGDTSSRC